MYKMVQNLSVKQWMLYTLLDKRHDVMDEVCNKAMSQTPQNLIAKQNDLVTSAS